MVDAAGSNAAPSKANLALGLGVGALLANILGQFIATDNSSNDWIWFVMAVLALAAVVVGLKDGRGKPRGRALIGTVIGALLLVMFTLFATGILS